jgi:superfamily I DNA/RNA helicase
MDVLFLCVDRPLARHLDRTIGMHERVTVRTFGELTDELVARSGADAIARDENPHWWSTVAPALMLEAVKSLQRRYDAIIVDEAQDIESAWWDPILGLLRSADDGIVYVFGDDNQDLYHLGRVEESGIRLPLELPRFELSQNRRTTREIHAFAMRFFRGMADEPLPTGLGPAGRDVEVHRYPAVEDEFAPPTGQAGRSCLDLLRRVLDGLVHTGKLQSSDIVILTPRKHRSWLTERGSSRFAGPFALIDGLDARGELVGDIQYRSHVRVVRLQDFKGLEAKVVVLAEMDGREKVDSLDSLFYVGATRARTHLVVIADEPTATYIDERAPSRKPKNIDG